MRKFWTGWLVLGDRLSATGIAGAAMLLAAVARTGLAGWRAEARELGRYRVREITGPREQPTGQ